MLPSPPARLDTGHSSARTLAVLPRRTNHPATLLPSAVDAARARTYRWKRHLKDGTVARFWWEAGRTRSETLATFVMGRAPEGHCWHHLNGNHADLTRGNLIALPRGQKLRHKRPRAVGVTRQKRHFRARLALPGEPTRELGCHPTLHAAADAVDQARLNAGLRPLNTLSVQRRGPRPSLKSLPCAG